MDFKTTAIRHPSASKSPEFARFPVRRHTDLAKCYLKCHAVRHRGRVSGLPGTPAEIKQALGWFASVPSARKNLVEAAPASVCAASAVRIGTGETPWGKLDGPNTQEKMMSSCDEPIAAARDWFATSCRPSWEGSTHGHQ